MAGKFVLAFFFCSFVLLSEKTWENQDKEQSWTIKQS